MKPRTTKSLTALELAKNFDALSDDQIVPRNVSYVILNTSEWTDRRHPLPLRRFWMTPYRYGHRVGDIRALVRTRTA
jgi:hypothetical protein